MMRNPLLPAALAAVLIFAACGSDDGGVADDSPVGSVDDDGDESSGLRGPVPIEITAGGNLASAEASADVAGAATSDLSIAPVAWIADYVIGDGMPPLPTNDVGYVFDAGATATADQVRALATAFGVDGEPVRLDEGFGTSWRVGSDDGTAAMLWLFEDPQLGWSYNSAWAEQEGRVACAVAVDSEGNEIGECPEIQPPEGVPTADEAEQRARQYLADLGADVSNATFDTFADEWFASVNVTQSLDAVAPGRSWHFGFGADGVLQFAGGTLAVPERVGPYPLIDVETAIARLQDQSGFYGGFGRGIAEGGIAVASPSIGATAAIAVAEADVSTLSPSLVEPSGEGSSEGSSGVPGDASPVDPAQPPPDETGVPMPVEPLPDPEPVIVTLVDVEADLWWAMDADGAVWLLPAYRFVDGDGGWHVVPAVTDDFLIRVEPSDDVPMPEPLPAPAPEPVEPIDEAGEDGVVDADEPVEAPAEPSPDTVDPVPAPVVDPIVLDELVGMALADFERAAAELGFSTRVVVLDGEGQVVTDDFSETRANVAVDDGIVVAVEFVG